MGYWCKKKKKLRARNDKAWVEGFTNELFVFHSSSCLDLREVLSSENKEPMRIMQESLSSKRNSFPSVTKGGAWSLH